MHVNRFSVANRHSPHPTSEGSMSESETRTKARFEEELLDFDEAKLWRGEVGPDVAEELASK